MKSINYELTDEHGKFTRSFKDLVAIGIVTILTFPLRSSFDVFEMFIEWSRSRRHGGPEVDGLIMLFVVLAFPCGIFSLRRWTEVKYEITERKQLTEERELVAKIGQIISSKLEIDRVYGPFADEIRMVIPLIGLRLTSAIRKETLTPMPTS